MPVFDLRCTACDWDRDDTFLHRALPPCPACGAVTEKVFKPGASPSLIDDSIPGGMIIENIDSVPRRFDSRSEHRQFMAARGLVNRVEHKPLAGTDKSPHTTRWI